MTTDPISLPFDAEEMLEGLRPWIETESPTFDAAAVNRMMDVAQHDLAALGARVERIPGRMGLGDSLRAAMPHPSAGEGGILVLGHMDTVHPIGTLKALPFRREGNICYGPGLMDMKGGNYVYLEAMRQILAAGIETPLPVTFLFTPDEEIGTPLTRRLIEMEARRHKYILVPEPARPDGGAVIGRYAIARFNLQTRGRPSHAGWALSEGRSAIAGMARKVAEIEAMTTEDCTFSVGVFHAGQWVNCVSSVCDAEVLTMAKTQELLERGVEKMMALNTDTGDVIMEVRRGVTRPVWIRSACAAKGCTRSANTSRSAASSSAPAWQPGFIAGWGLKPSAAVLLMEVQGSLRRFLLSQIHEFVPEGFSRCAPSQAFSGCAVQALSSRLHRAT